MAQPLKIVIESSEYGEFEGTSFDEVIKKAVETFAPYENETFAIDLIKVGSYYLDTNSVEEIQMEIEHEAKEWMKQAELEYKGMTEWTHPDTGGRF